MCIKGKALLQLGSASGCESSELVPKPINVTSCLVPQCPVSLSEDPATVELEPITKQQVLYTTFREEEAVIKQVSESWWGGENRG